MSGRTRVGLLFGGASVEHEVSVVSARGIASSLDPGRFECIALAVTGTGRWLSPESSAVILRSKAPRVEVTDAEDDGVRLAADPGRGGILRIARDGASSPLEVDLVFPVVHGWGGEDGRVQGLLDLAGIPFVGAGVLGSAVGMDKEVAKALLEARGLPVGPWTSVVRDEFRADPSGTLRRVTERLTLPLFVKPANGGSSIGVSKVVAPMGIERALETAFECDRKAVVESALDAREIECAVLGNERPEASVPGEIVPSREFYDYQAKYVDSTSRLLIPAPLSREAAEQVRRLAVETFRALDLTGMARIDFFVERGSERVFVNEANTLPGFTPISMYPKLWEASGVPYSDLLARLIDLALERNASDPSRARRRV